MIFEPHVYWNTGIKGQPWSGPGKKHWHDIFSLYLSNVLYILDTNTCQTELCIESCTVRSGKQQIKVQKNSWNEQRVRAPSCSGPDYKTHIYENKIAKSWISALASLFSVQIQGNCWLKLKRSSVRLVKTELSFLHKSFSSLKSRCSEELHVLAQPKNWEFEEWK